MNHRITAMAVVVCLGMLAGCSDEDAGAPAQQGAVPPTAPAAVAQSSAAPAALAAQPTTAPATHPAPVAAQASADPHAGLAMPQVAPTVAASNEGTVTSILNAGPYTYLQVDHQGRQVWIAGGKVDVGRGQVVRWGDTAVMRDFYSKSLDRRFDEILFVSRVITADAGARRGMPAATAPAPGTARGAVITVATGGGYTYIEVATDSGPIWLAAPMQAVKTGDVVSWNGGATMRNFNSSALNRTFDRIQFVGGVTVIN